MGFLGLFLVLSCGDAVTQINKNKRDFLAYQISHEDDEKAKLRLKFELKILQNYPQGWPELNLAPEHIVELIRRNFFLYDLKIQNSNGVFLEGFRLLAEALDPDRQLLKLIQNESLEKHPLYRMNDDLKFDLSMALGRILDSHAKGKSPITRDQLVKSFNARGNYVQILERNLNGYRSFVNVYRIAAHLADTGHHIKNIHHEFFGKHGQVLMEADIVLAEANGVISIAEVTTQVHENDYKRKFGQFHKYRRFQKNPSILGVEIKQVYVITTQTMAPKVGRELENRFGFKVMTW